MFCKSLQLPFFKSLENFLGLPNLFLKRVSIIDSSVTFLSSSEGSGLNQKVKTSFDDPVHRCSGPFIALRGQSKKPATKGLPYNFFGICSP